MNAQEIIAELNALNVVLSLNGDKLNYKAKPGALTPALKQSMIEAKREIIAILQGAQEDYPLLIDVLLADGWSRQLAELIVWCYHDDTPNKPFNFNGSNQGEIEDYRQFYRDLLEIINQGPTGWHAQNGNLLNRLTRLKKVAEKFYKPTASKSTV